MESLDPSELRARAREARERAQQLLAEAEALEHLADIIEGAARDMHPRDTMTRQEHARRVARGRRVAGTGPIYQWLDEIGQSTAWLAEQTHRSEAWIRACLIGRMGDRPASADDDLRRRVARLSGSDPDDPRHPRIRDEHWPPRGGWPTDDSAQPDAQGAKSVSHRRHSRKPRG